MVRHSRLWELISQNVLGLYMGAKQWGQMLSHTSTRSECSATCCITCRFFLMRSQACRDWLQGYPLSYYSCNRVRANNSNSAQDVTLENHRDSLSSVWLDSASDAQACLYSRRCLVAGRRESPLPRMPSRNSEKPRECWIRSRNSWSKR